MLGAFQAGVLANIVSGPMYGDNLVVNGEFTIDSSSWLGSLLTTTRVDSTSDPGTNSGGVDVFCCKLSNATATSSRIRQSITVESGKTYRLRALNYAPSSNTNTNAASMGWSLTTNFDNTKAVSVTSEDVWQLLEIEFVATATSINILFAPRPSGGTSSTGDGCYFDAVTLQEKL